MSKKKSRSNNIIGNFVHFVLLGGWQTHKQLQLWYSLWFVARIQISAYSNWIGYLWYVQFTIITIFTPKVPNGPQNTGERRSVRNKLFRHEHIHFSKQFGWQRCKREWKTSLRFDFIFNLELIAKFFQIYFHGPYDLPQFLPYTDIGGNFSIFKSMDLAATTIRSDPKVRSLFKFHRKCRWDKPLNLAFFVKMKNYI